MPTRTPAIVFSSGISDMRERRGRAGDGEHVGVVLRSADRQQRDDLRFVAPAGREQRTDRVDRSGGWSSTSFSGGLPSRLKNPPGMRPEA